MTIRTHGVWETAFPGKQTLNFICFLVREDRDGQTNYYFDPVSRNVYRWSSPSIGWEILRA